MMKADALNVNTIFSLPSLASLLLLSTLHPPSGQARPRQARHRTLVAMHFLELSRLSFQPD